MSGKRLSAHGLWAGALLLLISGCAGGRTTVSAGSPRELLRIFDEAVRDGDHTTAVACIDPSQRRIVEKAARAKGAWEQHASQVMALAAERFNDDMSQMLIQARKSVRDAFAGVVSWYRGMQESEVVRQNAPRLLLHQGRSTPFLLKKVERLWYLSYADPQGRKEECDYFALVFAQETKKLQLLVKGIKAAELSEEDVKAVLSGQKVLPGQMPKGPPGRVRVVKEGTGD